MKFLLKFPTIGYGQGSHALLLSIQGTVLVKPRNDLNLRVFKDDIISEQRMLDLTIKLCTTMAFLFPCNMNKTLE